MERLQNIPADISKPVLFNVYTPKKYKIFRFVFNQLFGGNIVTISQINIFGSSNIVLNKEPFSTMNTSIISPTNLRNMSSMNDYVPYNKFEKNYSNTDTENITEGATTMTVAEMQSNYGNTYVKLTTDDKYKFDYTGSVRSDKNKFFKDGITDDARHMLIQQNNMFLLVTLTVAFLTIGAIVISR